MYLILNYTAVLLSFYFFFYSSIEIVAIIFINIVRKIIIEPIDLQRCTDLEFSVEFKTQFYVFYPLFKHLLKDNFLFSQIIIIIF